MKITYLKNQKGFSHHFIMPVVAFLLVAGIGSYVMLQSSSAASKDTCEGTKLTTSWVTCKNVGWLFSKWQGGYYQYKIRILKTDDTYKYIEVKPLVKTYNFNKGKNTVKVSVRKWDIGCTNKDGRKEKTNFVGTKTVKFSKNITSCGTTMYHDVVMTEKKGSSTTTSKHTALKGDYMKI